MFEHDWRVFASLTLIALILYWVIVPNKAKRKEFVEQFNRNKRKAGRDKGRPKTYPELIITGITARRGDSITLITSCIGVPILTFNGISQGHYSETVYVVVTGDGDVKQYGTETLAQNAYSKGDYGILAVTMSPGTITQRSIIPEIIHPSNSFTLEFSARVNTK